MKAGLMVPMATSGRIEGLRIASYCCEPCCGNCKPMDASLCLEYICLCDYILFPSHTIHPGASHIQSLHVGEKRT